MPTSLSGAANPRIPGDESTMRYDRSIRTHLRWRLERSVSRQRDALVVEELSVCGGVARVDMAVLNGVLHGFEIKSERDTLTRLRTQATLFSEVMDYMTLVLAERFETAYEQAVPQWWGVAIARRNGDAVFFDTIRAPQRNPAIEIVGFLEFLWRDEAYQILVETGHGKGLKSAPRVKLYERLASLVPWSFLHDRVLDILKTRGLSVQASRGT
jgi:hypothetical protein